MTQSFLDGRVILHAGDSRDVLATLPDASIDSGVCDPPYALVSIGKRFGKSPQSGLSAATPAPDWGPGKTGAYARASAGFMGQQWDTGETAFSVEFWAQVWRVLKPGGHVVAFSGTRTYHRMVCAIEDAGFEIRDQLAWVYGSGFPKSHDVAKGIDKAAGAVRAITPASPMKTGTALGTISKNLRCDVCGKARASGDHCTCPRDSGPASDAARQWQGWGTALKPAWEPIVLARKPLDGTVAANVLAHGTGAVNIDGCRVGMSDADAAYISERIGGFNNTRSIGGNGAYQGGETMDRAAAYDASKGRWPANILHDGSDEVVAAFPMTAPAKAGKPRGAASGEGWGMNATGAEYDDAGGSAARFFYSAKADADDRIGSKHPTVKPVDLMQWLCRLVTPPGGTVLDPFAGTGTTGEVAWREGFRAVLIEREAAYREDIARRMDLALASRATRARESAKAKEAGKPVDLGPLFGGSDTVKGGGRQIYGHFADQDGRSGRSG